VSACFFRFARPHSPSSLVCPCLRHIDHTRSSVLVDDTVLDNLAIRSVCFSPNGTLLATGASDHKIRVCFFLSFAVYPSFTLSPTPTPCFCLIPAIHAPPRTVDFPHPHINPSPPYIASRQIWDIENKRILSVFEGHQGEVFSVEFSPDGRLLVSGSSDNTLRIWDMGTGTLSIMPVNVRALALVTFLPVYLPDICHCVNARCPAGYVVCCVCCGLHICRSTTAYSLSPSHPTGTLSTQDLPTALCAFAMSKRANSLNAS
jgi:WD40 repeat protein